ncbi:hypothetical protein M153_6097000128 [Pseudoloma neurophilia]|uniref:Uncharacterized protein n=1 Tax=Pseudoloma neurophilia TaxID=146866 RepID=A0A0R0M0C1_9MICR|nr:hypothetical protein M153_6097000128 [Pseudoloma neurophilia]
MTEKEGIGDHSYELFLKIQRLKLLFEKNINLKSIYKEKKQILREKQTMINWLKQ